MARADIRFPPGLKVSDLMAAIDRLIGGGLKVSVKVLSSSEPNWTDPDHEIVSRVRSNAAAFLGTPPERNKRLGFSDSRFCRYKSVPSVVYGSVPHNMGGPDEYVTLADLTAVFYVHATTVFDYLASR